MTPRKTGALEVDPLKVACPYCASKPGYACTSTYDYRVTRTHLVRVRLAQKEGEKP